MDNSGALKLKRVLLRGPVFSKSGYGEHTRQIYKYLKTKNVKIDIQALNWGTTPWHLNSIELGGLIGSMQNDCQQISGEKYDVTIQCQLPNEWDPNLGKHNIGVTAGIETTLCHPSWSSIHLEKMDKVIVPSKFAKRSLESNGLKSSTPIEVVPEAYYEELSEENPEKLSEIESLPTNFNFLTVGVLTGDAPESDRKNLFYLIKWFVEEFKKDKNVGLVIKTNKGRDTSLDKILTKRLLKQVLGELGHKGKPRIYLLHGEMSRKEMTSLYNSRKIKAFISVTRGEGFGLPFLEAATAGLPVIATNWSAHKEFLDLGRWISFGYDLKPVAESKIDGEIFVKGAKWAEVREDDFKKKVRNFYKKPALPSQWSKELSEKLREDYSIDSVIRKYDSVLGEILA